MIVLATIISLPVRASDSLQTVTQYGVRIYEVLNCDTNGTAVLDTHTVRKFARDAAIKAYTDIGIPKGKKIAIVNGTSGYLVDAALIWIKGIVFDTNGDFRALREIAVERLSDQTYYSSLVGTGARPEYYARHGDSIRIFPEPATNDSIYVFYFARDKFPAANADTINIPIEYKDAVVWAGAGYCAVRMNRPDLIQLFGALYKEEVMRVRGKMEFEGVSQDEK